MKTNNIRKEDYNQTIDNIQKGLNLLVESIPVLLKIAKKEKSSTLHGWMMDSTAGTAKRFWIQNSNTVLSVGKKSIGSIDPKLARSD